MTSLHMLTVANRHSGRWRWHLDRPERLAGWFESFPDVTNCHLVKDSCGRQVWRIVAGTADYHLKYSWPTSFATALIERFRRKTAAEFRNARLLYEHGIPGLEYYGYAENGGSGMLLSATLPDAVPLIQWCWERSDSDPASLINVARNLCRLVSHMHDAGLLHADWHGNNILCTGTTPELHVIDPAKIRPLKTGERQWPFFAFMSRLIPIATLREALRECDWPDHEADARLRQWLDSLRQNPRATQRMRKSLEDNSYLTTRHALPGASLFIRKTPWLTESKLDPSTLEAVALSAAEAERLWFESLLNFSACGLQHMPLAWRKEEKSTTGTLYYGPFSQLWTDANPPESDDPENK